MGKKSFNAEEIAAQVIRDLEVGPCSSDNCSLGQFYDVLKALQSEARDRAEQVRDELGEDE